MRKLDRPIPGVGPNDTVLVLSVFAGEDDDWNGTVVLGRVDGEDDITRLAGEAIEDRPQEDCSLAFSGLSPTEPSPREKASTLLRDLAALTAGDDRATAALKELEDELTILHEELHNAEYQYDRGDPCALDCNTHHRYMVVRGDEVIATWWPVDHEESDYDRNANFLKGVIVEHSGSWCCRSQSCHENYLSTPEEIKAALVRAGFVSGAPARDEKQGRVVVQGVRRRDGNGIDPTDGL